MLSRKLIQALRLSDERMYRLAHKIQVHPSTLSKWLNRIEPVRANDHRIVHLGQLLGLSREECFEKEDVTCHNGA